MPPKKSPEKQKSQPETQEELKEEVLSSIQKELNINLHQKEALKTEIEQKKHLDNYLKALETEKNPEKFINEFSQIQDIEQLKKGNVALKENFENYHLKHEKLSSAYLSRPKETKNINGNIEFTVDFKGNELAEWNIGAGNCLPPEVIAIAVYDENESLISEKAIRGIRNGRIGYFDEKTGEYAYIHTGYKIEILETGATSDERIKTQVKEEKEFFEKNEKKMALRDSLQKFFENQNLKVDVDEIFFTQNLSEFLKIANEKNPDWWENFCKTGSLDMESVWKETYPENATNLLYNLNLAGIKDLYLSDLKELLEKPELKTLQNKKFDSAEKLPPNLSEFLKIREVNPNENFVKATDDFGNPVTLRATAAKAFEKAQKIARGMGVKLKITSSYRSFEDQERSRTASIEKRGYWDRSMVAAPGGSPHHTGGAIDVRAYKNGVENQSLLWKILPQCGFVNYKREDWHWEIGTDRWKQATGARGPVYTKILKRGDVIAQL